MPRIEPAALVLDARLRAGLSQRALARRARTSQSVIARIEGRQTSPSIETLLRILRAAGFELRAELSLRPARNSHMLGDVARILALSPEERLLELRNLSRFETAARRV